MGVTGYGGGPDYPGSPSSRRERSGRPQWVTGGVLVASFVALLYVVEGIDSVTGHRLDENGIRPLETDGLDGILFAPLLHANWGHLVANTVPALVLGFLAAAAGVGRFLLATAIIWLLGGVGTWLIGNIGLPYETNHIGASGLIFGWLTYVIVRGSSTAVWGRSSSVPSSSSSTAACCGACCPDSSGCPGRDTSVAPWPACWRPTGYPAGNVRYRPHVGQGCRRG
ncbi:rhomboid family protein [Mycobacteroides abscessus]|nr:rhomboid family protein [Mycobacteroides abscessus]